MYNYQTGCQLGVGKSGLAFGYALIDADGTERQVWTAGNVAETAIPGNYTVTGGLPLPDDFIGRIVWGLSGATPIAEEWVETPRLSALDAPVSGVPAAVWANPQRTLTDLGLTGLGANPVTVTVQDAASKPIPGIGITVWNAAQSAALAIGVTDQGGQVTFNLGAGGIHLAVVSNLTYDPVAPIPYTVIAGAQSVPTITLTARVIDPAADPALCVIYGRLIKGDGTPVAGGEVTASPRDAHLVAAGNLLSKDAVASTTDTTGLFQLAVARGLRWRIYYDSGHQYRDVTAPAEGNLDLGTLPA
jgi:hypothetical protein